MVLKTSQLGALQAESQQSYIDAMLAHFRPMALPFMPASDAAARQYLQTRVLDARRYRLLTAAACERFLYLCLSYPQLNGAAYPPEIIDNLTWPDRSAEDKLDGLYRSLTGL